MPAEALPSLQQSPYPSLVVEGRMRGPPSERGTPPDRGLSGQGNVRCCRDFQYPFKHSPAIFDVSRGQGLRTLGASKTGGAISARSDSPLPGMQVGTGARVLGSGTQEIEQPAFKTASSAAVKWLDALPAPPSIRSSPLLPSVVPGGRVWVLAVGVAQPKGQSESAMTSQRRAGEASTSSEDVVSCGRAGDIVQLRGCPAACRLRMARGG